MDIGTWSSIFLITAAIILVIKNMLIRNIDTNYAYSKDINGYVSSYKKMFRFASYKLKNRHQESMSLRQWLEQEKLSEREKA